MTRDAGCNRQLANHSDVITARCAITVSLKRHQAAPVSYKHLWGPAGLWRGFDPAASGNSATSPQGSDFIPSKLFSQKALEATFLATLTPPPGSLP